MSFIKFDTSFHLPTKKNRGLRYQRINTCMDHICLLMEKLPLSDAKSKTKMNKLRVKDEKKKRKNRKKVRCWLCQKLGHLKKYCLIKKTVKYHPIKKRSKQKSKFYSNKSKAQVRSK